MKKIEDYLKYYMGGKCIITAPDGIPYKDYDTINEYWIERRSDDGHRYKITPILRPLSSLSKKELHHIAIELKAGTWNVEQLLWTHIDPWTSFRLTPDIIHYLLSNGFDLFNLIESGLAIPQPVNKERR